MKALISAIVVAGVIGLSNVAHATWVCGTDIKLDKVTVNVITGSNPTWEGSTVGDVDLGCTNDATFFFKRDLTVAGSKEALSMALAAYVSGSSVCLNKVSCNGSGYAEIEGILVRND